MAVERADADAGGPGDLFQAGGRTLRGEGGLRRLQQAGLADPALDPDLAALALSTMVSRSAYAVFAMGRQPVSVGELASTLTRLWANALGLPGDRQDGRNDG